jgi:uncharacterized protein YutE (UPF0331/DUF86 family)
VDDSSLDPMDENLAPLAQSIGRAVMGAAALEKVLLVDIVNRMAHREGLREQLELELHELERRSGGKLLEKLKELGLPDDLAARILAAIVRRNRLIHHYMEEPEVMMALMTGAGVEDLVAEVDELAVECQQIINLIAPDALAGLQRALGATIPELIDAIKNLDSQRVENPTLRQQLQTLQQLDLSQLQELFEDAAGAPGS